MIGGLDEMDLDAVTMRPQPRTSFVAGCDWAQTTTDVTLFVALPADARARDLKVQIDATELHASLRDGRPLLGGALGGECDPGESEWRRAGGCRLSDEGAQARVVRADRPPVVRQETIAEPPAVKAAAPPVPPTASTRRRPSPAAAATPAAAPPPAAAAAGRRAAARGRQAAGARAERGGLGAKYDSWNKFDEDEETLRLENEGRATSLAGSCAAATSIAAPSTRRTRRRSRSTATSPTRRRLQVAFNRRLRGAEFKTQGNEAMRVGNHAEAYELYNDAADGVEMITSRRRRCSRRGCRNGAPAPARPRGAAQAALKLESGTRRCTATQALAAEPAHPKALFRRASALHSHEGRRRRSRAPPASTAIARSRQRGGEEAPREHYVIETSLCSQLTVDKMVAASAFMICRAWRAARRAAAARPG